MGGVRPERGTGSLAEDPQHSNLFVSIWTAVGRQRLPKHFPHHSFTRHHQELRIERWSGFWVVKIQPLLEREPSTETQDGRNGLALPQAPQKLGSREKEKEATVNLQPSRLLHLLGIPFLSGSF